MLKQDASRQNRPAWQAAARECIAAAESGDTEPATFQMHMALLVEMMLDVNKTPL